MIDSRQDPGYGNRQRRVLVVMAAFLVCGAALVATAAGSVAAGGVVISLAGLGYASAVLSFRRPLFHRGFPPKDDGYS